MNKNATIKCEDPLKYFTLQEKLGEGFVEYIFHNIIHTTKLIFQH